MTKSLPVLYSRTSTGAVQQWEIQIQDNKYRMISGQTDGKAVSSEWTVCESKNVGRANETTGEEQALSEAQSKWDKKAKTGYYENVKDIDKEAFTEPMLAKVYADRKHKISFPVWSDIKYNGMRCIVKYSGMWSRKGEKILSAPHIYTETRHLFEKHHDLILDGELYNHEYRHQLNKLMEIVRRTKHFTPEHFTNSRAKVKYYVYDGYGFNGVTQDTPFSERKQALKTLIKDVPFLVFVETSHAKDEAALDALYESYLADGYEGQMVRIDGAYENKRSANLLKRKPCDDAEFVIVGIEEGDGNLGGMAGKIICKMDDGKTFGANIKGGRECNKDVWNNQSKYIGQLVTIFYNGFTGYGIPNYAQFDPSNYLRGD